MKCFNHPSSDAIGICKNCNKGLCAECLTEIEDGIACKNTCIEKVKEINAIISSNRLARKATTGAHYRNAFIYGSMGIIFVFFGITDERMRYFLTPLGILFIIGAFLSFNSGSKYKK